MEVCVDILYLCCKAGLLWEGAVGAPFDRFYGGNQTNVFANINALINLS